MEGRIKLSAAIAILNKKYCEKYSEYSNVEVEFDAEKNSYTYTDWGGFTGTEYYYSLFANIKYERTIGSVTFSNYVKKDCSDLNKDLKEELTKLYESDGYTVTSITIPTYQNRKYNLNDDVVIFVRKKSNKVLKKK